MDALLIAPLKILSLILALALFGCDKSPQALTFNVTFQESGGLQTGQFLVYKGIRIGEITNVGFDPKSPGRVVVGVRVAPEHRALVYREAEFVIDNPMGKLIDLSGERQLTMKDKGSQRTPLKDGDVVVGSEGAWGNALRAINQAWDAAIKGVGALISDIEAMVSDVAGREGQDLVKGLEEFSRRASEADGAEARAAVKDMLTDLKRRAEAFRQELEARGKGKEAQEFWRRFEGWVEQAPQGR